MTSQPTNIDTIDAAGELGPAMAELDPRERLFVNLLFRPNATGAARAKAAGFGKADSTGATLARIAHRKRSQPHIGKAIVEECQRTLRSLGPEAIRVMREILADKKHRDRGKMARFIAEKVEPALMLHRHEHDVIVRVDHEAESSRAALHARARGPGREADRDFGHSGLGRYEKMLAEQQRMKLALKLTIGELGPEGLMHTCCRC